MMRNRKLFFLIAIAILVSIPLVVFATQPSAEDLLVAALETMEATTGGHAVVELQFDTPEQSGSGTVEVWGKLEAGPDGEPAFRVEVLQTTMEHGAGAVAVSDGSQVWLWRPEKNTVYVGTVEELRQVIKERFDDRDHDFGGDHDTGDHPETPEEAVAKLLEYFEAERAGTETIGDSNAHKVRLIPIPEQMPDEFRTAGGLFHVWIGVDDAAPLGVEYTGGAMGSGKVVATMVERNGGVDESVFTFEIPDGAEVVNLVDLIPEPVSLEEAAATADFELLTPTELPAEASLVEVVEMRGTVVQRYALAGGDSFTVAQGHNANAASAPQEEGESVTVRGTTGTLYTDESGERTLLSWTEGELYFWIGGDLAPEQALVIAGSLQ